MKMEEKRRIIYKTIIETIRSSRSILLTGHEDPDGDSIGSQLALRRIIVQLGHRVTVVNTGGVPFKYQFLPDMKYNIEAGEYNQNPDFDLAIVMECPDAERTGFEITIMSVALNDVFGTHISLTTRSNTP